MRKKGKEDSKLYSQNLAVTPETRHWLSLAKSEKDRGVVEGRVWKTLTLVLSHSILFRQPGRSTEAKPALLVKKTCSGSDSQKSFWAHNSKGWQVLKPCMFIGSIGYTKITTVRSHMEQIKRQCIQVGKQGTPEAISAADCLVCQSPIT